MPGYVPAEVQESDPMRTLLQSHFESGNRSIWNISYGCWCRLMLAASQQAGCFDQDGGTNVQFLWWKKMYNFGLKILRFCDERNCTIFGWKNVQFWDETKCIILAETIYDFGHERKCTRPILLKQFAVLVMKQNVVQFWMKQCSLQFWWGNRTPVNNNTILYNNYSSFWLIANLFHHQNSTFF